MYHFMTWRISISNFSDELPDFTCVSGIVDLWSICLGINILGHKRLKTSATRADIRGLSVPWDGCNGNIPNLKPLRPNFSIFIKCIDGFNSICF